MSWNFRSANGSHFLRSICFIIQISENKEKSEKFFENIDKSTMRKRFLRSMNINSENLANGKIRSQLHQKLKNFYAGLYENQKVATNEMLKAMPNFNLDKISEQTQENIFDLKNVTSGLEEKIESKIEKIKMVDFFEDAKYSRDDLTHEAKDFLKLIYGDFGGPGKNGLSEKEIDEWSATEDMSFGEEMDSSVEGENVMSEISGERNDREETEDEFFTTKMDKDLKERMVRDLKERNKNVQGCENRAVFSDYDTGILIARKSVEDK
ncbi:hypothetical protein MHBO_000576 [Bonamia ostreae]|uniref:Uncharacterized protein n=1 Tax=Bonamia ostreae TaxID=126728 RepID=A0ABV2AG12_9EUKA